MKPAALLACFLLTTGGVSALAGGDADAGKAKAETCAACHGSDGHGTNPAYPVLAGQHASYLEHALRAYRDGGRANAVMAGMAAGLSDEEIENLAAYYAQMEGLEDLSIK